MVFGLTKHGGILAGPGRHGQQPVFRCFRPVAERCGGSSLDPVPRRQDSERGTRGVREPSGTRMPPGEAQPPHREGVPRKAPLNRKGVLTSYTSRACWQRPPMSRKLGIKYPGATYHVMNRGDRRERYTSLKRIAQRLTLDSWTCVSNLLNEQPSTHPQAQEVLPLCQQ